MPTMEASPHNTFTSFSSNPSLTLQKTITRPEDSTYFKTFHITKASLGDFHFSSTFDTQEYRGEVSLYNPKKRDVILHLGPDTKGPIVGDADLKTFSGHYTIELGDYIHGPVILECLDRVKGWSSRHAFSFSFGGGERERFVWRHKGEKFVDNGKSLNVDWDDMELVTDRNDDEEELLVAQYLKRDPEYRGWKGRGCLQLRSEGGVEWERMVILSLMALLVTRRREQ
jgi:hypothetical protein